MAKVIDTNLLIRFFTEDDIRKADAVEKLLKTSPDKLVLPDVVISEVLFVLKSVYKLEKDYLVKHLKWLLSRTILKINRRVIAEATSLFEQHNIGWVDAYVVAYTKVNNHKSFYSYDQSLDKIRVVKRLEP